MVRPNELENGAIVSFHEDFVLETATVPQCDDACLVTGNDTLSIGLPGHCIDWTFAFVGGGADDTGANVDAAVWICERGVEETKLVGNVLWEDV